jgi:putative PIN family toxin of toxin-antitoxin system
MLQLVLDTNVLVSALIAPYGIPASILGLILQHEARLCYDARILSEYEEALERPKFNFEPARCRALIKFISRSGLSVVAAPSFIEMADQDGRMFYEVACACCATLITGNLKHFPKRRFILSPADFWQKCLQERSI